MPGVASSPALEAKRVLWKTNREDFRHAILCAGNVDWRQFMQVFSMTYGIDPVLK